jgi:Mn2+/Fe2+ NRAMP family transporter
MRIEAAAQLRQAWPSKSNNPVTCTQPVVGPSKSRLLGVRGPGLITGASDDDPSGIATYSQAGAQFEYALTWSLLFTYPLMTAVQIVSARMGRTTGRGIAGNLRQHCPSWLLTAIVSLLLIANAIIRGDFIITGWTKGLGWVATAAMAAAVAAMLATS